MAAAILRFAFSGRQSPVSYAFPIFTLPLSAASAPCLNQAELGSVAPPFIMTIWASRALGPSALSSASP